MSHNTSTAWAVYQESSDGYESISVYRSQAELREALIEDLYEVMGDNAEQLAGGSISRIVSALHGACDRRYYTQTVSI